MERVGPILVPSPQISRAICIHTLVAGKGIEKSAKTSPGLAVIKTIMSKTLFQAKLFCNVMARWRSGKGAGKRWTAAAAELFTTSLRLAARDRFARP